MLAAILCTHIPAAAGMLCTRQLRKAKNCARIASAECGMAPPNIPSVDFFPAFLILSRAEVTEVSTVRPLNFL